MKSSQKIKKVRAYYNTKESRFGYSLLLKGIKHFGYYPRNKKNISVIKAQRLMEDKLAKALNLPKDSLILDAGCGEGKVAHYLAQRYGFKIIGIDLIDWAIAKANKTETELNLQDRLKFYVSDYTSLAKKENTFDGIYTMETLVHSPNYKKALREFYRVLKPHGHLALFEYSVRDRKTLPQKLQKEFDLIINETGMHSLPYFIHGKFPDMLRRVGFRNIKVRNITIRIMPMLKLFYMLAFFPYHLFIKPFNLKKYFINATFSVEAYHYIKKGYARYNIVTAVK